MEKEEFKKIDLSAKKLWVINAILSSIVIMGIAFALYHFAGKYLLYWPLLIGAAISFLDIFVHPVIEYKQWGYKITEDRIEFTHGIYYKKKTIIPISKVQHLNISQGPIQKHFKLATIEIYTAGSAHKIEQILAKEAEEIVENLNKSIAKVILNGEV